MGFPVPPEGSAPTLPTPRPTDDLSGGILEMAVTRGPEQHRSRFHIREFRMTPTVDHDMTTVGGSTVTMTADYAYVFPPASIGGGNEQSVGETISNLRDVLSWFYNSDWNIAAARLFRRSADTGYSSDNPTRDHPFPSRLTLVPLPQLSVKNVQGVNSDASVMAGSMLEIVLFTTPVYDSDGLLVTPRSRGRVTLLDSSVYAAGQTPVLVDGGHDDGQSHPIATAIGYLGNIAGASFNTTSVVARNNRPFNSFDAKVVARTYQRSMRRAVRQAVQGTLVAGG